MAKKYISIVTVISFLCILLLPLISEGSSKLKEGSPPPFFTLMDESGRMVNLEKLIDRPTVMYFTHNACFYCVQIIAYLKRAQVKFQKDKLLILGVNVMAKDQKLIKSYRNELGFTFPMFAGNREDVLRAYDINYVPVIIFVDSKKNIRKVVGHYIHEPELHKNIQEIMK